MIDVNSMSEKIERLTIEYNTNALFLGNEYEDSLEGILSYLYIIWLTAILSFILIFVK